ncbi:MAG: D-alanyl-D-alanine carboxypeptidase [Clostridia bacterium]|nr:D-alanyl-D-alanine carboxypeptidase [Clostridia bacterium]
MKKRITLCFVLLIVFVANIALPMSASAANMNGTYISSQGACVMDFETGEIYYHHNGNTARVPASMTKIMNIYCVYEAISSGEISYDTVVPISTNVYNKSRNSLYQNMIPLYYNTKYTVKEMIDVILVHSASAAAVAVAELIDGTESAYAARMTRTARAMGVNATFYDSCGVADNRVTPIGMATIARNVITKYPGILEVSAQKGVYFHGGYYPTSNHLLDTFYYEGADGLKTGTGSVAGACFCGTASRDGRRMISVTMGSSSTSQRFVDSARLLDYGFAAAKKKYDSLYFTDMSTFINGHEVPTFARIANPTCAVVVVEDLRNYGFDVTWYDDTKTLVAKYNPDKEITPMPLDYYKGKTGKLACSVYNQKVNVVIDDGATQHHLNDVFNLNGYMGVSVDEFKAFCGFGWDEATRSINISITGAEQIVNDAA